MSKSIAPRCDARCDAWREKCPPHASQNLKRSLQPTETEGLAAPIIMHTGNANFRLPTPLAGLSLAIWISMTLAPWTRIRFPRAFLPGPSHTAIVVPHLQTLLYFGQPMVPRAPRDNRGGR